MKQQLISSKTLSELWDCDADDIRDLAKAGMPHNKTRTGQYLFDLADCQAWYRNYAW